jgi:hypothetical protein
LRTSLLHPDGIYPDGRGPASSKKTPLLYSSSTLAQTSYEHEYFSLAYGTSTASKTTTTTATANQLHIYPPLPQCKLHAHISRSFSVTLYSRARYVHFCTLFVLVVECLDLLAVQLIERIARREIPRREMPRREMPRREMPRNKYPGTKYTG